jgi:hypothetical protein
MTLRKVSLRCVASQCVGVQTGYKSRDELASSVMIADLVATLSLIVSGLALVVSGIFGFRQYRLDRKVAAIEEERRAEEVTSRLTADVTAEFESRPRRGTAIAEEHSLVLINRGPARAIDVDIEYPDDERLPRLMTEGMGFPIALDPGQRFRILAIPHYGGSPSVQLTLRWTDGRGSREKPLTLASP